MKRHWIILYSEDFNYIYILNALKKESIVETLGDMLSP